MQLHRHSINLRKGDLDLLDHFYSPRGLHASQVIRRIISDHVDALKRKELDPEDFDFHPREGIG